MKRLLTIFLLFFSLITYSQDNKLNIKICPLSLIDGMSFPTIQGGCEIKLSDKLSWYNELGFKYRDGIINLVPDTLFIKSSGLKFKSEIRYYLARLTYDGKSSKAMNGFYISTNFFYIQDFHNSEIAYYHNKDSTVLFTDAFAVRKHVYGLNVTFGFQDTFSKHISIDLYAGIGIRFRKIHNSDMQYNPSNDSMLHAIDLNYQNIRDNIDTTEGLSWVPNLTAGFRIGYQF